MLLHILWMILKIILIVLGILLMLLLLILMLVLFCPVRYRASAVKEGSEVKDIAAEGSVSWLFHGIWVKFYFTDGKFTHQIRIFGIALDQLKKIKGLFLRRKKNKNNKERRQSPSGTTSSKQVSSQKPKETLPVKKAGPSAEKGKQAQPAQPKLPEKEAPGEEEKKQGIIDSIKNKIAAIQKKGKELKKIPETLKKLWDRLIWLKSLWEDERIQAALQLMKRELKKILKHVFPTKISGEVIFGSEDPAVTGLVLGILGITMPLHKNLIAVNPVYEGENILQGKVSLKGRIYAVVLLTACLKIYFNKNIKYALSRWKHKED